MLSTVMGRTRANTNTNTNTNTTSHSHGHSSRSRSARTLPANTSRDAMSVPRVQALLQKEGYKLLRSMPGKSTMAKAVKQGHVVALKLLRAGTRELEILSYLQIFDSNRNHTIQLLHVVHSDSIGGDIIVMPWQTPLDDFLALTGVGKSPNVDKSLQSQFLEGVWFLHEHRIAHLDLKPGNILIGYGDASSPPQRLSIINFGISIRVESQETTVTGYRGTSSWSAPEVGTANGPPMKYSTILADWWSCGRVLHHIERAHPVVGASMFASTCSQLLSPDPECRPSLDQVLDSLCVMGTTKCSGDTNGAFLMQKRPRKSSCWYVWLFLSCALAYVQAKGSSHNGLQ
jgi:serine/threonine protein kinase